jgi:hypothetical protein
MNALVNPAPFIQPDHAPGAGADLLVRISAAAALMREQEATVSAAELALAETKEALRVTQTELLPELMREAGMTELTLANGDKLQITAEVQCGITDERRVAAFAWLAERGFGGLIKTAILIPFARTERDDALRFAHELAEKTGREVELSETIHPQTLKSFIKEQLALGGDGEKPPADVFGIFPYDRAKLTAPKLKAAPRRGQPR